MNKKAVYIGDSARANAQIGLRFEDGKEGEGVVNLESPFTMEIAPRLQIQQSHFTTKDGRKAYIITPTNGAILIGPVEER